MDVKYVTGAFFWISALFSEFVNLMQFWTIFCRFGDFCVQTFFWSFWTVCVNYLQSILAVWRNLGSLGSQSNHFFAISRCFGKFQHFSPNLFRYGRIILRNETMFSRCETMISQYEMMLFPTNTREKICTEQTLLSTRWWLLGAKRWLG